MSRYPDLKRELLGLLVGGRFVIDAHGCKMDFQCTLPGCGRPDVLLSAEDTYILVEVKVSRWRGLTKYQALDDQDVDVGNYLHYLEKRLERNRLLVLLVPPEWEMTPEVRAQIQKRKDLVEQVTWDKVLNVVERLSRSTGDVLLFEYYELLNKQFARLSFTQEETAVLIHDAGSLRTVQKLNNLVDKVVKKGKNKGYKFGDARKNQEMEYGVYFNVGNDELLWFGIWTDLWENEKLALSFGIPERAITKKPSLEGTFKGAYGGNTKIFENYLLGGIPLAGIPEQNADAMVWGIVEPILEGLQKHLNSGRRTLVA